MEIILSATQDINAGHHVLNIAVGQRTSLNDLSNLIKKELEMNGITVSSNITYRDFRYGDVRHSQASIKKAKEIIAYEPAYKVDEGIRKAIGWYIKNNEEISPGSFGSSLLTFPYCFLSKAI